VVCLSGHLAVELPASFAATPVTPAESAKWLEECRRSMPVMLQHIAPDAPFFEYVKKERDVDVWKYVSLSFPLGMSHVRRMFWNFA
jgi:hypothetical protein